MCLDVFWSLSFLSVSPPTYHYECLSKTIVQLYPVSALPAV